MSSMIPAKYLSLPLLVVLAGCDLIFPYDPAQDSSPPHGDGPKPPQGDFKFDGLSLEGPTTTLDGGGCSKGILNSDFATMPSGWLFKDAFCGGSGTHGITDCGGPSCLSVSDAFREETFATRSIKKFTLGLRFKMAKAPTCEVVLFRLGNRMSKKSDLDYGIRLAISPVTPYADPALWIYTLGRWSIVGATGLPLAKLKEAAWYSVEVRGRTVWDIHVLDVVVSENGKPIFRRNDWLTAQWFNTLRSYQFGALTKNCCKPLIDYDWVCFLDQY